MMACPVSLETVVPQVPPVPKVLLVKQELLESRGQLVQLVQQEQRENQETQDPWVNLEPKARGAVRVIPELQDLLDLLEETVPQVLMEHEARLVQLEQGVHPVPLEEMVLKDQLGHLARMETQEHQDQKDQREQMVNKVALDCKASKEHLDLKEPLDHRVILDPRDLPELMERLAGLGQ